MSSPETIVLDEYPRTPSLVHLPHPLNPSGKVMSFAMDGDELMILVTWPDGFSARISMGPVASAMIERRVSQCTNLH